MFVHFEQFCKQMVKTPLLGQSTQFIVCTPEIADQNALEDCSKNKTPPCLTFYKIDANICVDKTAISRYIFFVKAASITWEL